MIFKTSHIFRCDHISDVSEDNKSIGNGGECSPPSSSYKKTSNDVYFQRNGGQSIAEKLRSMLHIGRHKWAPEKRFVISSMSDSVVRTSGLLNALDRRIPKSNRFELEETSYYSEFGELLHEGALSTLDCSCRLDLHGHGNMFMFEDDGPFIFACKLKRAGLREVGVIKFQSCRNGKGDFLKEFLEALDQLEIRVGYVSAPIGGLIDGRSVVKIAGREFTYKPAFFMPSKLIRRKHVLLIPETFGLKVIKGNIDVKFEGTRYS
ncbi:hypothetical protein J2X56_000609 [Herbaspirillum sp. 1173]|uniref:hypothetical protein n=1 Tax=unclassified Herbaspirillum TaxID=2624150 RepID=UPI001AE65F1E|nr:MULTISPECIES: hypothetical protein [unclassified Herbaspirillum]MBP1313382.1 hypothetical protein [Herbaspirillum sp. 1130]MDR6738623.1 hypothetical protein [Herbaspirillum sp. 1173]